MKTVNEINFYEQKLHAELAEAAYNFDLGGEAGPHNTDKIRQSLKDKFDITVVHTNGVDSQDDAGEAIYRFEDKVTGEVYLAVRGTDDFGPNTECPSSEFFGERRLFRNGGSGSVSV